MDSVGQACEETRRQSATTKSVFGWAGFKVSLAEAMKEGELSMPKADLQRVAILPVSVPSPQPLRGG